MVACVEQINILLYCGSGGKIYVLLYGFRLKIWENIFFNAKKICLMRNATRSKNS